MAKYYYAFDNRHGIGTRSADTGKRIGRVHEFGTRYERDEWINADEFDGNWHREQITSTEARREMLDELYRTGEPFAEGKAYMERYGSMGEILAAYHEAMDWGMI